MPKHSKFEKPQLHKGVDFVGVSVVFFCHDGKGNFLMQKRGAKARDENGNWDIGAGGVEVGESIEETLRKEIKEEYCCDIISHEFLGFREIFREHQGKKTHWIGLDFKVLVNPDQAKNGEPHKFDEIGWFTLKNLPTPGHSQMSIFVKKYRGRL